MGDILIISDRINTTRPRIRRMAEGRDETILLEEVKAQKDAGAEALDFFFGDDPKRELAQISWAISSVLSKYPDIFICVDSRNPAVFKSILPLLGERGILNSLSLAHEALSEQLSLVKSAGSFLIAMTFHPKTPVRGTDDRVDLGLRFVERVLREGIPAEKVFLDPVLLPVRKDPSQPRFFLKAAELLKEKSGVRILCALSNVSAGFPGGERERVELEFLKQALDHGIDTFLMNPKRYSFKKV